jgi:undecaprenyl-diphosphatase
MSTKIRNLFNPLFTNYYWVWPLLAAILFAAIALTIPELKGFDSFFVHLIKTLPKSLKPLMELFSNIASVQATIGLIILSLLVLCALKKWKFAVTMLAALTTLPLFGILKLLVKRARPDGVSVAFGFHNDSFPSGHAAASAIVFLTIAYIVDKNLNKTWSRIVAISSVVLIFLIGVSRIYLGFHFPTDVLAGWLVAIFVFLIVKRIADGKIDSDAKKPL